MSSGQLHLTWGGLELQGHELGNQDRLVSSCHESPDLRITVLPTLRQQKVRRQPSQLNGKKLPRPQPQEHRTNQDHTPRELAEEKVPFRNDGNSKPDSERQ